MAYHLVSTNRLIKKEKKKNHLEEAKKLKSDISFQDIYHVIILATYNEPYGIIKRSVQNIIKSNFPVKEKVFFVLAYEERAKDIGKKNFELLKNEFENSFKEFYGFTHPDGIKGDDWVSTIGTEDQPFQGGSFFEESGCRNVWLLLVVCAFWFYFLRPHLGRPINNPTT